MDIIVTSSSNEEKLMHIIEHSSTATIFHAPQWNKLVSQEFGIPYHTLVAFGDKVDKKSTTPLGMYTFFIIKDGLIKRIVSPLRDADSVYGGPIAIDGAETEKIIRALIIKAESLVNYVKYYQICTPPNYDIKLLKKLSYKCKKLLTFVIELNYPENNLWNKIHSKRRNLIRKAISKGLKIVDFTQNSGFIDIYYPMLLEVFDKSNKKPFPKTYYQRIIQELTPKGWIKLLLALSNDKPIAGAIFLCFKDTIYYWSGASFRKYGDLAPNDLIQWEIIKWANQHNYKYYDLLIVDPVRLPGITHFKSGFGGELVPIYEAIHRTLLGQITRGINFIKSKVK